MFTTVFIAFLGLCVGFVTGLSPGLHPNTVIAILLPIGARIEIDLVLPFLIGMVVTHSMINHIPAILLGAPDSNSVLATLPGKQFLLDGKADKAIINGLNGGLVAMYASLFLLGLGVFGLDHIYTMWEPYIPFGLSAIVLFLIIQGPIIANIITVIATGFLGIGTLMMTSISQTFVLFPLLTGLFGASMLIATLRTNPPPEQQQDGDMEITSTDIRGGIVGAFTGLIAGLLPGLGPSATLALFSPLLGSDRNTFMAALGGINTADTVFSLVAIYLIGRARSGAAVAVQQLTTVTDKIVIELVALSFLIVPTAFLLARHCLPVFLTIYTSIPPKTMIKGVLVFLTVFIILICGLPGLGIFCLATAVGIMCDELGARKSLCMACLIVPVILFTAGVNL